MKEGQGQGQGSGKNLGRVKDSIRVISTIVATVGPLTPLFSLTPDP